MMARGKLDARSPSARRTYGASRAPDDDAYRKRFVTDSMDTEKAASQAPGDDIFRKCRDESLAEGQTW